MESSSYESRKQALIKEITAAFDGVQLEDGVSLHEAPLIDDYRIFDRNHYLRGQARAKDNETRWQDIPDEHIRSQLLLFLDSKGFHYYIPVFLIWYLRYVDREDEDIDFDDNTFGEVDFLLRGGIDEKIADRYLAKFSTLTLQQSQAIAHFLEFMIVWLDKWEVDYEVERQTAVALGTMTEEEAQKGREWSRGLRLSNNDAEQALERYWSQFL